MIGIQCLFKRGLMVQHGFCIVTTGPLTYTGIDTKALDCSMLCFTSNSHWCMNAAKGLRVWTFSCRTCRDIYLGMYIACTKVTLVEHLRRIITSMLQEAGIRIGETVSPY